MMKKSSGMKMAGSMTKFSIRSTMLPTAFPKKIRLLGPTSIDATIDKVKSATPI